MRWRGDSPGTREPAARARHGRAAAGALPSLLVLLAALAAVPRPAAAGTDTAPLPVHRAIGGDFALSQPTGPPARLSDYRGKVVLLSFGFTHCPDVCPATLSRLASAHDRLGEAADATQVLFVSFDPERDTPEHLRRYLQFFDESFVGISGPESELRELAARYRIVFDRVDREPDASPDARAGTGEDEAGAETGEATEGDYSFAHTNRFFLIDRAGRVRKLYRPSASPEQIADEVRQLLAEPENAS